MGGETVPGRTGLALGRLRSEARRLGFWGAVLLPVGYLPLLVGGAAEPVVALLAAHLLCLWLGHGHSP